MEWILFSLSLGGVILHVAYIIFYRMLLTGIVSDSINKMHDLSFRRPLNKYNLLDWNE